MRVAFCHKDPGGKFQNLIPMAKVTTDRVSGEMTAPEIVARQTAAQPDGFKCIQLVLPWEDAAGMPTWLDREGELFLPSAERFRREQAAIYVDWAEKFHKLDGQVDIIVCDFEASLDLHEVISLNSRAPLGDLDRWLNGSLGAAGALRQRLGLIDYSNFRLWASNRDRRELIWNARLHEYVADVLTDVFYWPFARHYSNVKCINYEHGHYANQIRCQSHRRYNQALTDGDGCHVGTHSGRPCYGQVARTTWPNVENGPVPAPTPRSALAQGFIWSRSLGVASLLKQTPWGAWVTSPEQTDAKQPQRFAFYGGLPEWQENIRHIFGCGAEFLLYWHNREFAPRGELLSRVLSECDDHFPAAGAWPSGDVLLGENLEGVMLSGWPGAMRLSYYRGEKLTGSWLRAKSISASNLSGVIAECQPAQV